MKQTAISLILLVAASVISSAELFKVSEVPSIRYKREKLIELFEAAKDQNYVRFDGAIVELPQLAYRREEISQVLSGTHFLTRDSDFNSSHVVSLVSMDAAEDESLLGYYLERGTYTYTTVLGASRTVRSYFYAPEGYRHLITKKYIESNDGELLTRDVFLEWIKEGNEVSAVVIETCRKCQGSGWVSVGIGERVRCRDSNGTGLAPKRYELVW